MNKIFWGFLVALLVGMVVNYPVNADTPTPTTTPTPYEFAPTGWITNPGSSTGDLSCSPGNPMGWGVVTPDPLWYLLCNQCVDRLGTATPIQLTATPDQTTPTLTPTTATTNYIDCNPNDSYVTCIENLNDSAKESRIRSDWQGETQGWTQYSIQVVPNSPNTFYVRTAGQIDIRCGTYSPYDGGINFKVYKNSTLLKTVYMGGYHCSTNNQIINFYTSLTTTFSMTTTGVENYLKIGFYDYGGQVSQESNPNWWSEISLHPFESPTATPTPTGIPTMTPTPGGYCGYVNGSYLAPNGRGMEAPPPVTFITYGEKECKEIIPDTVVSWLGLEDTIPSFSLCFQEITLDPIEFLGVSVNPMILIYAVMGVTILMWIFKT